MRVVPRKRVSAAKRLLSNCLPRFVVIIWSTPNRAIQWVTKAWITDSAVMVEMGIASGQRVNRSMQVKMYGQPFEGGKGPTMSI